MIKLFRKLRKKLLEQGKTATYLKYAIGEIILVVIGILIALQVNEWNNDQNSKKAEQIVLIQIKSDLEKSVLELEEMKDYHLIRTQTCANILRAFWKTELPNDSIANSLSRAKSTINYSPILGNLKALINSGDLALISSLELKNDIVFYVENVESQLRDITRAEESYFRKGVELINEIMPNDVHDKAYFIKQIEESVTKNRPSWWDPSLSPIPREVKDIEIVPFKSELNELFQNKQFYNGYRKLWTHQFNSFRIYDEILALTNELLTKLNTTQLIKSE